MTIFGHLSVLKIRVPNSCPSFNQIYVHISGISHLIDFVEYLLDVFDAVRVGDDVEGDGHGGVDQDPLEGADVSVRREKK